MAKSKTATADAFSVSINRTMIDDSGLQKLKAVVRSKENLIRKAFGTTDLRIETTEEKVTFPWFSITDGKEAAAYCTFIVRLCEHAKGLKHVSSKDEKTVENDKYAFRCFLLRLGLIGDQYKETRKVLLKNLTGSSAFRSGTKPSKEVMQ